MTIILTYPVWNNDDQENCFDKFTASANNALTHAKNGNNKIIRIIIIQINKGSADIDNKIDLLMANINNQSTDLAVISEANYKYNDPRVNTILKKATKGYKIEYSSQLNHDSSRCIILIKKKIP